MISGVTAHLWQSTLFVGAAWLITLVFRTNRAQVRYWVWFIASTKFLLPFSLLTGLGGGLGGLRPHHSTPAVGAGWATALQEFSQPPLLSTIQMQTGAAATNATNYVYLEAIALILWACGFGAVTIFWRLKWRRVHALCNSARLVDIPTRLQVPVPIMSTSDLIEPGVVGILRPVLLLPEGIAERLNQIQLDAIVTHELCHIRRRDNLTAGIHMAVQAIFWFHPLTWWIGTRLVDERERACDEEVLRNGCRPSLYAESILVICKSYLDFPLACVSGVTGSNLRRRIEAIMRSRNSVELHPAKKLVLGAAGVAVLAVPIIIGALHAPAVRAQDTRPRFEVASLKAGVGCDKAPRTIRSFTPSPNRLEMPCMTLQSLIQAAFGTFGDGVSINPLPLHMEGAPSWMKTERYTVSAKAEAPARGEMLVGPMLQGLLEERFRLKVHREMREMPVYAMAVGKEGLKAKPLSEGACTPVDLTNPTPPPPPPKKPGDPLPNLCAVMIIERTAQGETALDVRGSTLTQLTQRLSQLVDRTVIDKTDISGRFNFHLEFAPDLNMPGQRVFMGRGGDNTAPPSDPGPDLFIALQEQIGLKLSSEKGPVSILIIDHVEQPTPN